jgi:quercetin dioxygenase-like cupin family protein
MPIVRREQCRRTETPNAVMTTLASPTLGGAECAIWRVDMNPGHAGPLHLFDREQVWTIVVGGAIVELGPHSESVAAGDTIILPPGVPRRMTADPGQGLCAIVTAAAGARASLVDGTDRGVPGWIA